MEYMLNANKKKTVVKHKRQLFLVLIKQISVLTNILNENRRLVIKQSLIN